MMSKGEALDLMICVDALIERARRIRGIVDMGEVDWSDLGATGVWEEYHPLMPPPLRKQVVVLIKSARPHCKLVDWLMDRLERDVIVRAERGRAWTRPNAR
ncbi:MAG: hypothetical protein V6Z86_07480 [Hyphomicrobiales bacterium]